MKNSVKWGVIACGKIANEFARTANATESGELYAVAARTDLWTTAIMRFEGDIIAKEVAMRYDDTFGNMKALDWWRAEIGLSYEADRGSVIG